MTPQRGYYSLIQFCPDASRMESVNVGVMLFCPAIAFIGARMAKGTQRAAKLVGRKGFDRAGLNGAKRAMERRLKVDAQAFRSLEDLQRFVDTRGNILQLTAPRPVKVLDPDRDLGSLFDELVGGKARVSPDTLEVPELDTLFHRLKAEGRAKLGWDVEIPLVGRRLHVPYAFQNGVWNLVTPHHFGADHGRAMRAAMHLAIEGDLLQKHGRDHEGEKKLIVLASFEEGKRTEELAKRVASLFDAYEVTNVPKGALPQFLNHVEQTAH